MPIIKHNEISAQLRKSWPNVLNPNEDTIIFTIAEALSRISQFKEVSYHAQEETNGEVSLSVYLKPIQDEQA